MENAENYDVGIFRLVEDQVFGEFCDCYAPRAPEFVGSKMARRSGKGMAKDAQESLANRLFPAGG